MSQAKNLGGRVGFRENFSGGQDLRGGGLPLTKIS